MRFISVFTFFSTNLSRKVKSLTVYGGVSINPQMIELQGVEILVATPGRLLDLISNRAVSLSAIKILVLDEADSLSNVKYLFLFLTKTKVFYLLQTIKIIIGGSHEEIFMEKFMDQVNNEVLKESVNRIERPLDEEELTMKIHFILNSNSD